MDERGIEDLVERHAKAILSMDIPQITSDLMPEPLQKLQEQAGGGMAMQIDSYEVLGHEIDGDDYLYDVRYAGKESFTVRARWSRVGDAWRIVDADLVNDE
ncbi:MAG: hypothetical protein IH957_04545 [Chloroflexi bacterium]|nr:hypothetical protein [Chloroflexota bacterium]